MLDPRSADDNVRFIRICLNPRATQLATIDISWVVHAHLIQAGCERDRADQIRESIHLPAWSWHIDDDVTQGEMSRHLFMASLDLHFDDPGRSVCVAILRAQAFKRSPTLENALSVRLLLQLPFAGLLEEGRHQLYLNRWSRLCQSTPSGKAAPITHVKPKSELQKAIESVIEADAKDAVETYQRVIDLYVTQPSDDARKQIEAAVCDFPFRTATISRAIQRAGADGARDTKTYLALELPLPTLPPAAAPEAIIATLRSEFPWLSGVIDAVELDLLVSARFLDGIPHLTPKLLVGGAGSGKTSFCSRLAELMGGPAALVNAAGASSTKLLTGTSRGWSNNRPCLPAELMVQGRRAQCCLIIDEIEKESSASHHGRFSDGLLNFLEPSSNSKYFDECLFSTCDFGGVNWLATANSLAPVSAPLLSRFQIVQCDQPTAAHMPIIVESSLRALRSQYRIHDDHSLLDDQARAELDLLAVRAESARACALLVKTKVAQSLKRGLQPAASTPRSSQTPSARMH